MTTYDPTAHESTAVESTDATPDGGVIVAGDEGELLGEDLRPEACGCGSWNADTGLPCWPCYRAGFETPAAEEDL